MENKPTPKHRVRAESVDRLRKMMDDGRAGFDITCVVGHVTIGDGDLSATEAAFLVIARHGADGLYSFPGPAEDDVVTVEVGGMSRDYFTGN